MKSQCYYFLLFLTISLWSSASSENCSDVCKVVEQLQSQLEIHADKLSHFPTYERRTDVVYQWYWRNRDTLNKLIDSLENEPLKDIVGPEVRVYSEMTTYNSGSDITIHCEVTGYPVPKVSWYKDNQILQTSERVQMLDNDTVIITRAEALDSGTYLCKAVNPIGNSSSPITINVEGIPLHPNCTDNPYFANCRLIVQARYCTNKYYRRMCCKSCTLAGQLPSLEPHLT